MCLHCSYVGVEPRVGDGAGDGDAGYCDEGVVGSLVGVDWWSGVGSRVGYGGGLCVGA